MSIFLVALMLLGGVHASKQHPKVILNDKGEVLRDERVAKVDSVQVVEFSYKKGL